jgi:antagonist of KipI
MAGELEIVEPGILTSIQDLPGRPDFRHLGVPAAGAVDPFSAALANRLVGNAPEAALLEITLAGLAVRFATPVVIGIAGADLGAELDGLPVSVPALRRTAPGAVLRFMRRRRGARAYLAVAGGLAVEPVLDSRSTDLRSGFGGVDGRPLSAGDRLDVAPGQPERSLEPGLLVPELRRAAADHLVVDAPFPIVSGPHPERFAPGALDLLCTQPWRVSADADRAGIRLEGDGALLAHPGEAEVPSVALPLGAVQVPPDARPIIMLADRPVTGGYPVIGCVARAAIGRAAQLLPGDEVRFTLVSAREARDELRRVVALLRDGIRVDEDAAPLWAGALD